MTLKLENEHFKPSNNFPWPWKALKKTVMPLLSYITNVPYLPGIRGSILNSWALWTFICIVLLSRTPTKYLLTTITIPLFRDPVIIQLSVFFVLFLIQITSPAQIITLRWPRPKVAPNIGESVWFCNLTWEQKFLLNTTVARFTSRPKNKNGFNLHR